MRSPLRTYLMKLCRLGQWAGSRHAYQSVAGILFLLIITLQSGLVCRDREVHTMPADRIPAEVMLAICGMALIGMVGIAGLGLTGSGNPTDGFGLPL